MVLISVISHLAVLSLTLRKPCQERGCYQSRKHYLRTQSKMITRTPGFPSFPYPSSLATKTSHKASSSFTELPAPNTVSNSSPQSPSPPHSGTLAPVSCLNHILKKTLHTFLTLHVLPAAPIPLSSWASRKASKFYFTSAWSFSFLSAQSKSTALLLCTRGSVGVPVNKRNCTFLPMHLCM